MAILQGKHRAQRGDRNVPREQHEDRGNATGTNFKGGVLAGVNSKVGARWDVWTAMEMDMYIYTHQCNRGAYQGWNS